MVQILYLGSLISGFGHIVRFAEALENGTAPFVVCQVWGNWQQLYVEAAPTPSLTAHVGPFHEHTDSGGTGARVP